MIRINVLVLAGAAVISTAAILAVSPAIAADTATASVAYSDLDLSTQHGRAALDQRIRNAAGDVCRATNGDYGSVAACRRQSVAATRDAVAQAHAAAPTIVAMR